MERRPIYRESVPGHPLGGYPIEGHPLELHPLEGHAIVGHSVGSDPVERHSIEGHSIEGQPVEGQPIPIQRCLRGNCTQQYQATTSRYHGSFDRGPEEPCRASGGPSCLRHHDVLLWSGIHVRL